MHPSQAPPPAPPPKKKRGCLGFMKRQIVILVLGSMLGIATALNVYAGGMLYPDETCRVAHPLLFGVKVSALLQEDLSSEPILPTYVSSGSQTDLEIDEEFLPYFDFQALPEESCVEEFGFHNSNTETFQFTLKGYKEFAPWITDSFSKAAIDAYFEDYYELNNPTDEEYDEEFASIMDSLRLQWPQVQTSASIEVSPFGRFWLYFLLPLYLVMLPVLTIRLSRRAWGLWWYVMVGLVTLLAVTSALLYINYADITGIGAFSDFGTGVFGGTITATALAFLTHIAEVFGEMGDD